MMDKPTRKPIGSGMKFVLPPAPTVEEGGSSNIQPGDPPERITVPPVRPRAMSGAGLVASMIGEAQRGVGQRVVVKLDPNSIEASQWADRHPSAYETPEFLELKESIRLSGGNIQPVKVRAIRNEGGLVRYQLVFGSRRSRACRDLGYHVNAVVEEVDTDRAVYLQMVGENRGREGLSPWEQGMSYHRALRGDAPLFGSVAELVSTAGLDSSNVSKAMRIAGLPPEVVTLFRSPTMLTFRTGMLLVEALKERPDDVMAAAATLRSKEGLDPTTIVATLVAKPSKTPKVGSRISVKLPNGKTGELAITRGGALKLHLPQGAVPSEKVAAFQQKLEELLRSLR